MKRFSSSYKIKVAARPSPLSRAQVEEVFQALGHPYEFVGVSTSGDIDKKTSLRDKERTDFFTDRIDALVLSKACDVSVHSAKDLPSPLPEGLKIVALTLGEDPSDSLVFKPGYNSIDEFPTHSVIATSSHRRENNLKALRNDLTFIDIRGTIHERLALLGEGVDGVVVAEAALRRLGLNPPRQKILGETSFLQGKLAVMARAEDKESEELFQKIDSREKNTLYLGLRCPCPTYHHDPAIQIEPFPYTNPDLTDISTILITSPTAAHLFHPYIGDKKILCTGEGTAKTLALYGYSALYPKKECSEGLIDLIEELGIKKEKFFWPHSLLSRPLLKNYLQDNLQELILYTTKSRKIESRWQDFKKIVFTSSSCERSFIEQFGKLPENGVSVIN